MKSLLSVLSGSVLVIVALLFLQLIYILIAVAYNAMALDYPFLNEITGVFRYIIGLPLIMLTMFAGGYVTASILKMRTALALWIHCATVGLITSGGMMYSAIQSASLTLTGVVLIVVAVGASSAGGFYWLREK